MERSAELEAERNRNVFVKMTDVMMAKHLGVTDLAFDELMHYKAS